VRGKGETAGWKRDPTSLLFKDGLIIRKNLHRNAVMRRCGSKSPFEMYESLKQNAVRTS